MTTELAFKTVSVDERFNDKAVVVLGDAAGNSYSWKVNTPDAVSVACRALAAHRLDQSERDDRTITEAIQRILDSATRVHSGRKMSGRLEEVENGRLVSVSGGWDGPEARNDVLAAFEITEEFLHAWLQRQVEVVVMGGCARRITAGDDSYPPRDTV